MKIKSTLTHSLAVVTAASLTLVALSAHAQQQILAIEFNEDDQDDFDLWPNILTGGLSESIAEFVTDTAVTSGTTTVKLTTNTAFNIPANRAGSVNGDPIGYTYQNLYEDLLHAGTPTGALTFDFDGLLPNFAYRFTLYAWDPGATDASDKEWTVTGGTADPSVLSVNFQDPLIDNETFALVFDITTTETGTFQVVNTNGLPQSAINGFRLESLDAIVPLAITDFDYTADDNMLSLTWNSVEGATYVLKYSNDLDNWDQILLGDISGEADSTTRIFDLSETALEGVAKNFFRVEIVPPAAAE